MKVNSKKGGGIKSINGVIQEACKEKIERDRKRGILNRPVRAMVVGIPECRKINIYQCTCGKGMCKDRKQAGSYKRKAVDQTE